MGDAELQAALYISLGSHGTLGETHFQSLQSSCYLLAKTLRSHPQQSRQPPSYGVQRPVQMH